MPQVLRIVLIKLILPITVQRADGVTPVSDPRIHESTRVCVARVYVCVAVLRHNEQPYIVTQAANAYNLDIDFVPINNVQRGQLNYLNGIITTINRATNNISYMAFSALFHNCLK